MQANPPKRYLPAAGHAWLLPLYDPLTRLLGLEAVHRRLVELAGIRPGQRVLEIGCGTGNLTILIKQLHGVRCPNPGWEKGGMILSCSDAIAKAMERYLLEKKTPVGKKVAAMSSGCLEKIAGFCPDCGGALEHESGCAVCRECGFSKCG